MAITSNKKKRKHKQSVKLYAPTPLQERIHNDIDNSGHLIYMLTCGRRWGKNIFALNDMARYAIKNGNKVIWWCSPVYRQAKRDYRRFKNGMLKTNLIGKPLDTELRVPFKNGTVIEFHGLEDHENLLGEGVNRLYIDEAPRIKQDAWEQTLQPMLLDTSGKAILFGTPKGKNWFYHLWARGNDKDSQIKSYQHPTHTNPYIDINRLEKDLARLPRRVIDQEYYALFVDAGSGIFAGYIECISDTMSSPEIGRSYRIGCDIAKHQDFTVLTTVDVNSGDLVDFERFNKLEYSFQKRKIYEKAVYYNNAEIVIDSTGVGEPLYDDLKRTNINVIPYKFTNASKIQLVENLAIKIQNKEIRFPEIPELIHELDIFEIVQTPSGNIRYTAPSGMHDDCVFSLAMAVWDIGNKANSFEDAVRIVGNRDQPVSII